MVAVVPFAGAPGGSVAGVLAAEGFAVLLFAVLCWGARWPFDRRSVGLFLKTGPNLPVLLFLGLVIGSCLWASNKDYGLQECLRIGAGVLLYFVVAYQFRRSEYLAKLYDTLLFVGIAVSLLGFVELASGAVSRPGGPFGNANLLGGFLMLLLPVVAVVAVTGKPSMRQLVAQVAAVLMVAAILVSQTRSSWLGMAAGLGALGGLTLISALRTRGANPFARKHELVVPAMLLVAVGLFVVAWPQFSELASRSATLARPNADVSLAWRGRAARGALRMLQAHPWTGVGIGQYPLQAAGITGIGVRLAGTGARPSMTENAHNYYLQTAAELGAPGALLLAAILAGFLVAAVRRALRMDPGLRRSMLLGSIASIVGFSVDALSNPAWTVAQTSIYFWLVLGLGVGCFRPFEKRRERADARSAAAPAYVRPVTVAASLALAAMLTTVTVSAETMYRMKLDHVAISPASSTIKSGLSQIYTCYAWYLMSDGSVTGPVDVTGAGASFSKRGFGVLIGTYHNTYQSTPRLAETALITTRYSYNSAEMTSTAALTVVR